MHQSDQCDHPSSVTSIESDAFFACENLTDIYYSGSESQWNAIDFGSSWSPTSYPTSNSRPDPIEFTVHYNSAAPAPSTNPVPTISDKAPTGITVSVDRKAVVWTDATPFIDANSRTMVPLRAVADAMGLDVNWVAAAREASFTGDGKTIYFPIDSTIAHTSDGSTIMMDTAVVIVNDRTYAPIRYLAEYFGYTVGWDQAAQTVSITT